MSSVHFQSFEKDKDDENQVIFSKTMEAPPMLTQQFKGDGSGQFVVYASRDSPKPEQDEKYA